jgi:putative flippase GtrA
VGYALYLIVTWAGVGPKTTMSILYVVGTAISFVLNRNWSFRHDGTHGIALAKFVASYALGYLVNFCGLWLLVNRLGLPHQAVQAAMTLVVAALLFVLLRHFVFRTSAHGAGAEAGAA